MTYFDRILEHEIDTANDHLPSKRVSLKDILAKGDYFYQTRGGEPSAFRKEEIERLLELVPEHLHSEIRLPLIILRRMDLGPGMFTLSGGKTELYLLCKIIEGEVTIEWNGISEWVLVEQFVRPQIQILRRLFPSTTVIGFTLTSSDD